MSTTSSTAQLTANALSVVGDSGTVISTYKLANNRQLTVAQGSVVDFASTKGAIVNAANEGCLFGGGVDGAISSAGGPDLHNDRLNLPRLRGDVRCNTGDAKLTGPGDYGSLQVPFVIHAVGPNYMMFDEAFDVATPHRLLRSAYYSALDCTLNQPDIHAVAFSLLSAGIFRGEQSVGTVLCIGVQAIRDWSREEPKSGDDTTENNNNNSKSHLQDIVLFAFTDREARTLQKVCDFVLLDKKGKHKRSKLKNSDEDNDTETETTEDNTNSNDNEKMEVADVCPPPETTEEENSNANEKMQVADACPPPKTTTEDQDQETDDKAPEVVLKDGEAEVCTKEEAEEELEKESKENEKEAEKESPKKEQTVDEKGIEKPSPEAKP